MGNENEFEPVRINKRHLMLIWCQFLQHKEVYFLSKNWYTTIQSQLIYSSYISHFVNVEVEANIPRISKVTSVFTRRERSSHWHHLDTLLSSFRTSFCSQILLGMSEHIVGVIYARKKKKNRKQYSYLRSSRSGWQTTTTTTGTD